MNAIGGTGTGAIFYGIFVQPQAPKWKSELVRLRQNLAAYLLAMEYDATKLSVSGAKIDGQTYGWPIDAPSLTYHNQWFYFEDTGGTVTVIDDYGHHPVEMAATLAAARGAYPGRRLVLAFQPHRYTRTCRLLPEFAPAFDLADQVIITEIYPAGEAPVVGGIGSRSGTGTQIHFAGTPR